MFLILMIPIHEAQAGALAYTGRMNKAIGGAIVKAGKRMGFAANDPRFAKTVYAAANEASFAVGAGTTAATVAAIAGAPVWATVAVGVGVAAAFGYIAYKAYQLATDDDGKVYIQPDPQKPAPPKPKIYGNLSSMISHDAIFNGGSLEGYQVINYDGLYHPDTVFYHFDYPADIANSQWKYRAFLPEEHLNGNGQMYAYAMSPTELSNKSKAMAEVKFNLADGSSGYVKSAAFHYTTEAGSDSPIPSSNAKVVVTFHVNDSNEDYVVVFPVEFNPNYVPAVRESMSTNEAAPLIQQNADEPVDPQVLVKLANKLWQNAAAKPGYDGLPYDNANPLTEADVQAWRAENPAQYPTQGDLLNPTNLPGEQISLNPDGTPNTPPNPDPNPDPNPVPNPGGDITIIVNPTPVTVNVNPVVDFGSYPNKEAPTLEDVSPSDITDAIKNSILPATNFSDLGVTGQCPKPSFTIWDRNYIISAHCDLFESIAPVLQSVMVALFALVAFFIVMSA